MVEVKFFVGLILYFLIIHVVYALLIVPFHHWASGKMGMTYDSRRNRYLMREPKSNEVVE